MQIRELYYHGKKKKTGEWVTGHLLETCLARYIVTGSSQTLHTGQFTVTTHEIIPESLGLCTGYFDRDDYYVYEGDILEHPVNPLINLVVLWDVKSVGIVVHPFKDGVVDTSVTYRLNELVGSVTEEYGETRARLVSRVVGKYIDVVGESNGNTPA